MWLAIYVDGYELWDGWILASLVFWAIAVPSGPRRALQFERAAARGPRNAVALRRACAPVLQTTASAALLLLIVMMIFKPGA